MKPIETLVDELIDSSITLFGNPIGDWVFTQLEIKDAGPSLLYYSDDGEVSICLSNKIINDNSQLIFQLSHEICHLLHPSKEYPSLFENKTLVINEGVSTYFSIFSMEKYCNAKEITIRNLNIGNNNYYDAYVLVDQLLQIDFSAIKKLREVQPRIDKLILKDFEKSGLKIPKKLKLALLEEFH